MEELEKHNPKENVHTASPNPAPPTQNSTTSSKQDISPESKHKACTSSPKMNEKQNNHQASNLGNIKK